MIQSILKADDPESIFRSMKNDGSLQTFFPEIYALIGQNQPEEHHPEGDAFEHTMQVLTKACKMIDNTMVRYAALMHDIGKGVTPKELLPAHHDHDKTGLIVLEKVRQRSNIPNHFFDAAHFAIKHHMRAKKLVKESKKKQLIDLASASIIGLEGFACVLKADRAVPDYIQEELKRRNLGWK